MFCLDSNIAIAILRGGRPNLEERLAAVLQENPVGLSAIVLMELEFGVRRALHPERARAALDRFLSARFELLQFTEDDAVWAASIRADLAAKGVSIGPFDSLIAAQAVSRGLILVTNNIREFSRIPGLKTEDWLSP